jgi:hypothetical protein
MTRAELQEIFAEIDAGFENFKCEIDAMLADGDLEGFEAVTRRLIAVAAALRGLNDERPLFQTCH